MAEKQYIEREAVLRRMQKIATEAWKMRIKANVETVWNEAQDVLRFFPAADVRPVVLCRDCIHYKPQQKSTRWSNTTPMCSRSATIKMPPDGFCSFGVKREES